MRLRGVRGSRNVEDRRGRSFGRRVGRTGGLGLLGVIVVLAVGFFTGIDVTPLLQGQGQTAVQSRPMTQADEQAAEFTTRVLATTEEVWSQVFAEQVGRAYQPPVLVLFADVTPSPCGGASGATGPFYCPIDQKAYLDTAFFATLRDRMGAGGDFAAAYVVAHEVAHHVQNQLGILDEVMQLRTQITEVQGNALTVRLELQADCLSGVWGRAVEGLLDPGDIEEALNAARMIGDDHLQRQAGRIPRPHTFTHGTSEQRQRWFARGFESGEIGACDTFAADRL